MAYQQIQTASEPPIDGDLITRMLKSKISALSQGILLTDNFISEIEDFEKRNSLSLLHEDFEDVKESCPRCLKAHMLSSANLCGLTKEAIKVIEELVPGEIGHNGYYLDEGELKKASSFSV